MTDEDINHAAAVEFMGWVPQNWDPEHCIGDAWMLVEKWQARGKGYGFALTLGDGFDAMGSLARFWLGGKVVGESDSDYAPEAITRAALAAKRAQQ